MKNIKYIMCCWVFLFVFCFSVAYSSNTCDFNGLTDPSEWEKVEFSSLLKSEEMPNYLVITRILGMIAVTDSSILESPKCTISNYVALLIKYYNANKIAIQNKHKNVVNLMEFIKFKLRDEPEMLAGEDYDWF